MQTTQTDVLTQNINLREVPKGRRPLFIFPTRSPSSDFLSSECAPKKSHSFIDPQRSVPGLFLYSPQGRSVAPLDASAAFMGVAADLKSLVAISSAFIEAPVDLCGAAHPEGAFRDALLATSPVAIAFAAALRSFNDFIIMPSASLVNNVRPLTEDNSQDVTSSKGEKQRQRTEHNMQDLSAGATRPGI